MTIITAKWSIDDYHHIVETGVLKGRPVELLNGEIIEMSPEREPHSASSSNSGDYLRELLGDRVKVREGHPITIASSNSEPEPDLAIVRRDEDGYWEHHPYPEDIYWLIEFSDSSLKKDLDPKAKAYAAAGIAEYWVVNLKKMELVVMRSPLNGEYQSQVILTQGEIRPLAFQDVAVAVAKLLRKRR
jgi:Uma2 family endonuclease